jgi:hypothetical protein
VLGARELSNDLLILNSKITRIYTDFTSGWHVESVLPLNTRSSGLIKRLFFPQGDHWVHTRGAANGDIASDKRDCGEQESYCSKSDRIGGADAVQHASQEPGENEDNDQPDGETDAGEDHPLSKDELADVPQLRTERHSQTDLAGSSSHNLRHHSVNTDGGEYEREDAETPQYVRGHADGKERDFQSSPISEKGARLSTFVSVSDRKLFTGGSIFLKVAP